jgi:hypothetical protein
MIYGITALIFGIPNVQLLTTRDDGFIMLLFTSLFVVVRFISYIKLAGFALLDPGKIKKHKFTIAVNIWFIALILLSNAAFLLYRFGFTRISVAAVSIGSIGAAGVLISHLMASRGSGLSRSHLMKMVSGVLIVLGAANICINPQDLLIPSIGVLTLFLGIYTERKSLTLALRQTFAVAGGSLGGGIMVYFLRWYLDPAMLINTQVSPLAGVIAGMSIALFCGGYYVYSRRQYVPENSLS